jgi:hypothetical protein
VDIAGVDRKRAEYGHVSLNGARIVINVVNLQSEGKKKRGLRSMTVERMTREFRYEGAADPSFDAGQAYVVYDGRELRACRDATAAIAAVVRAKRPCSAVDLSAIRTATTE